MTQQIGFSEIVYDAKKKQTRRDVFLAVKETIVPCARLVALIAPRYPTSGRPPLGIERMRHLQARSVRWRPSSMARSRA